MSIVVDLGCAPHGDDRSIEPLVIRFKPRWLHGFDPLIPYGTIEQHGDTTVILQRKAAWTYDGDLELGIGAQGLDTTAMRAKNGRREWGRTRACACFDFSRWLTKTATAPPVVVKMDIEGAEFPVLDRLHATGADKLVSLLLVEWHDAKMGAAYTEQRARLERELACPVEEWDHVEAAA